LAAKLCHLTSGFSGRISEAIRSPRKIPKSFKKSFDAISRFAVKGYSALQVVSGNSLKSPAQKHEKTN
jgi:hypothetical protein